MNGSSDRRRTRTVNFRLSEQEFEVLQRACAAEGARSLSDFARLAVSRLASAAPGAPIDPDMERIDRKLEALQRQLDEMAELLRASRPETRTAGNGDFS